MVASSAVFPPNWARFRRPLGGNFHADLATLTCSKDDNVCAARTVDVESCPENVTSTVTSLRRTSHVTWPAPVFVGAGGRRLSHVCSVDSGSEFVAGTHHVVCYPPDYPAVACQFIVDVVGRWRLRQPAPDLGVSK